jgi:hypothetical protein
MLILNIYRPPCSYFFSVFAKMVSLHVAHPLNIYQNIKFRGPIEVLHPSQIFGFRPRWNGYEATFNGMISLLNLIKIYLLVQMLIGVQTDTGW